ncbi:MAG: hypothetical protein U0840_07250 [Gemmataceae bacterium]
MVRFAIGVCCLLSLTGCLKNASPTLTEVELVVMINGQPLPNALVTLTPTASGLGGAGIASGVTDDSGLVRFTAGGKQGAAIGVNKVTIIDAPPSEELRGEDPEAQQKLAQYQKRLKNRPIPAKLGNLAQSDVDLDIKAGQKQYKLDLTR